MGSQAPQYQAWCTGEPFNTNSSSYNNIDNTAFWANPKCIQLYKAHVKTVLTRWMSTQVATAPACSTAGPPCKRSMLPCMLLNPR